MFSASDTSIASAAERHAADPSATMPDRAEALPQPARGASERGADILGSFWIGGTEFALPVAVIHEVVNEPEGYTPVPHSPAHIPGLFCLRHMIVPVVDLRILLGFAPLTTPVRRKVALIEQGNLRIGLLVDELGGVIDAAGAERVMFRPDGNGQRSIVVEGVLKLDNGRRLVQLLDPYRLIGIEKLPLVGGNDTTDDLRRVGPRQNCITFQLGPSVCAIDLRHVQEIADLPKIHSSQVAHGHTLGNIELRQVTMPVVDLCGVMGRDAPARPAPDSLRDRKVIVLKLPEGHVALMVHSVDSILSFFAGDLRPFANVALPRHDLVAGCLIRATDDIVILLDHDRLAADPGLQEAARSCRAIYPSAPQSARTDVDRRARVRATYVLFTVDVPLALDIACVSEIIARPDTLLRPPYALAFVHGILNLRGELITVIDPRVIYGLPPADHDNDNDKILIFQEGTKKYGIVVSSVEEILTLSTNDLLPVPTVSDSATARRVSQDVRGCLRIPSRPISQPAVMVLEMTALIARCVAAEAAQEPHPDRPTNFGASVPGHRQHAALPSDTGDLPR